MPQTLWIILNSAKFLKFFHFAKLTISKSVFIHLDLAQCFNSAIDNSVLGFPKPPLRSYLGEVALNTLFATWKKERQLLEQQKLQALNLDLEEKKKEIKEENKEENKEEENTETIEDQKTEKTEEKQEEDLSNLIEMSKLTPVIISDTNTGRILFYSTIGEAKGTDKLPAWVEDCVLRVSSISQFSFLSHLFTFPFFIKKGAYNSREENKYRFSLKPTAKEKLNPLPA